MLTGITKRTIFDTTTTTTRNTPWIFGKDQEEYLRAGKIGQTDQT